MQILGNGPNYGQARRLWLRSEDNDSLGLTLLPTLFTLLPPSHPSTATTSQPILSYPSLLKEALLSDNTKACRRAFWSSCDAALYDRPQTQIFSFPIKEPQLWRLVEKTSDTAAVEIFYYTATSCYLSLHLKKELDAWMCLCVNVSSEKKEAFHLLSFSAGTYATPPRPLKVRPGFTMRSESASFFYLKGSFQAYEKRD